MEQNEKVKSVEESLSSFLELFTQYSDEIIGGRNQEALDKMLTHVPQKSGFINAFDKKVQLLKAWVENDVLIVDFNSRFEYNRYGHLGLKMQIQQVLWTAFGVSKDSQHELNRVSFLINGRRKERLGGEGLVLKPFYSRLDLVKKLGKKENV